jgi:hypothetical protein
VSDEEQNQKPQELKPRHFESLFKSSGRKVVEARYEEKSSFISENKFCCKEPGFR